jgi:hypothetical protein
VVSLRPWALVPVEGWLVVLLEGQSSPQRVLCSRYPPQPPVVMLAALQ